MGFLQIIDFHTDRVEEFIALERRWEVDSAASAPLPAVSSTPTATTQGTTWPSTGSPTTTRRW